MSSQVRAAYYEFARADCQPLWRRSLFVLVVASLHLLGLLLGFGVVMQPSPAEFLPVLSVRVLDPARPAATSQAVVAPPRQPERARSLPARSAMVPKASSPQLLTTAAPATTAVLSPVAAGPAEPVAAVAAVSSSAGAAPVPAPLLAARFDADYLHNPRPVYPAASRRLGEEGRVILRVRVSAQGLPLAVDIKQSSGFARLDEAARAAVERWRFVPARQGHEAVESSVLVPLQFTLDS